MLTETLLPQNISWEFGSITQTIQVGADVTLTLQIFTSSKLGRMRIQITRDGKPENCMGSPGRWII